MFGNIQEKQEEIKKKLASMSVNAEAGDGAIRVEATGDRTIKNISIDNTKLDSSDTEELEDLLLIAVNRALELAGEKEAEETERLMKDMLPPGFGGLGDLFG